MPFSEYSLKMAVYHNVARSIVELHANTPKGDFHRESTATTAVAVRDLRLALNVLEYPLCLVVENMVSILDKDPGSGFARWKKMSRLGFDIVRGSVKDYGNCEYTTLLFLSTYWSERFAVAWEALSFYLPSINRANTDHAIIRAADVF